METKTAVYKLKIKIGTIKDMVNKNLAKKVTIVAVHIDL